MRRRLSPAFALAALAAVGGCALPEIGDRPNGLVPTPPPVPANALQVEINAPAKIVQRAIVSRARARGTSANVPDPRTVQLERALADTPPALAASCGPHKLGRIVRVIITTDEEAGGLTRVVERRFVVDTDGTRCAVVLSQADMAEGNKSLLELRNQIENEAVRR